MHGGRTHQLTKYPTVRLPLILPACPLVPDEPNEYATNSKSAKKPANASCLERVDSQPRGAAVGVWARRTAVACGSVAESKGPEGELGRSSGGDRRGL